MARETDAADVLAAARRRARALVHRDAETLTAPDVVVTANAAVLTAVVRDDVERDGVADSHALRLTQVWVRDDEGWRCLAGHAGPRLEEG